MRGWHTLEPGRPLVRGWALEAICEHLEAVSRGEIRKLLINVPPGCTKSMTVGVFWPAWEWGPLGKPHLRYISASYEASLSMRDNVRCRDLIQSEWYQSHWSVELKADQNAKGYYETSVSGSRLATSVRGALMGKRGDRIIVDDPHDVQKVESDQIREEAVRWFAETLPTRVNDAETSPFVVIMQRLHERDISGFIISKELGYEHLCLPMEYEPDHPYPSTRFKDPRTKLGELLWPERFSREAIEDQKTTFRNFGGSYAEAGQFQQRPTPRGGGMFQRKDFKLLEEAPGAGELVGIARGWDLAATEDPKAAFSAGVKIARTRDGKVVVLDVRRGQWSSATVYAEIRAAGVADAVRQSIPQDPGQAGKDQKRHIGAYLEGLDFTFSPESGDKVVRARPLAAQAEAGNLYLVRAPWNDAYIAECCSFPRGHWKDQVDASSRAYAASLRTGETVIAGAPVIVH